MITPEAPQRAVQVQISVNVSQALYELIQAEIGHCGCHMQGFVRYAIAAEVQRRRNERASRARQNIPPGTI